MKLLKISLKNFLCYSGDNNEIEFSDGLNLILGANGYGKTKLYDAFNWLFFDGITNRKDERTYTSILKGSLISKKAIEKTKTGEIECKVVIELEARREEFLIERKYKIYVENNEILQEDEKSTVKVFIKTDLEYVPYDLPIEYGFIDFVKEKIIPTDILPHIWFQGERGITKAVDTSNGKALLQVINKISYIDMWERYVSISENANARVKNSFDKEARKSKRNQQKREGLQTEINRLEKILKKNAKELGTRKEELSSINGKIENISITSEAQTKIIQLKKEEERLTAEYKTITEKLNTIIDLSDRNLFDKYWIIHNTQASSNSYDKLYRDYIYEKQQEIRAAKEGIPKMPKGIPEATHLRKMIKDCHCYICDRPAPKGEEAYNNMKKLLPENYPSLKPSGAEYLHEQNFKQLSRIQQGLQLDVDLFKDESEGLKLEYFKLDQRRAELKEQIEGIKDKITLELTDAGLDSAEIGKQIAKKYKSLNEQSSRISNAVGRLENQILEDLRSKKELDTKLIDLLKSSGTFISLTKKRAKINML